jgi:hypothetical protein
VLYAVSKERNISSMRLGDLPGRTILLTAILRRLWENDPEEPCDILKVPHPAMKIMTQKLLDRLKPGMRDLLRKRGVAKEGTPGAACSRNAVKVRTARALHGKPRFSALPASTQLPSAGNPSRRFESSSSVAAFVRSSDIRSLSPVPLPHHGVRLPIKANRR